MRCEKTAEYYIYEAGQLQRADHYRPLVVVADVDDGCSSSCFNDTSLTPLAATEMVGNIDTLLL